VREISRSYCQSLPDFQTETALSKLSFFQPVTYLKGFLSLLTEEDIEISTSNDFASPHNQQHTTFPELSTSTHPT